MDARLMPWLARALVCAAVLGSPWAWAAEPPATPPSSVAGAPSSDLDAWTGGATIATELRTPRAALETFLEAGEAERFDEAAVVLNLADLPSTERVERAADLAEKLYFVLDRRLDVDWREVPDRADGARDGAAGFSEEAATSDPTPRDNLFVGSISGDRAPVEVRLERVEPPGLPPVWLIARSTVRSIDVLYERHGPGWFDRNAPAWALATFGAAPVWQWLGFLLLVLLSVGVATGLERLTHRSLGASEHRRVRDLGDAVARPLAVLAGVSVLWLTTGALLSLSGAPGRLVSTTLTALFVAALTWFAVNAVNALSEAAVHRWLGDRGEPDRTGAQRRLTNLSVARRTLVFAVLLVGFAAALAQFEAFRTVGTSLLASAGVAGIVLGVAAQDSLSNVMAGIQIALTKLVRIGDTVYFEGNWSTVEDITYTYVILRTWDQRRIAVPNRHLVSHPLENWAMTHPNMVLPVLLHVDYRTPVDVLRSRYVELLEAAEDWDREQAPQLQVIEATEDTLQVRVLCSAKDASTAWDLHCYLREELVAFLRGWDDGRYLPRSRVRLEGVEELVDAAKGADAG